LLLTSRSSSVLTTHTSQLVLNNVCVAPTIIYNLLFVRQFTRDNSCSTRTSVVWEEKFSFLHPPGTKEEEEIYSLYYKFFIFYHEPNQNSL
jgi:hypothetical protein